MQILIYLHIKNNIQMMLIPEVVNLPHNEMEFVRTYMQMFQDIGFDIEEFGDNSIKINGIPDIDYKTNSKHIFLDIFYIGSIRISLGKKVRCHWS